MSQSPRRRCTNSLDPHRARTKSLDEDRLKAAEGIVELWKNECMKWQAQAESAEERIHLADHRTTTSNARLLAAEAAATIAEAKVQKLEEKILDMERSKQAAEQRAMEMKRQADCNEKTAEVCRSLTTRVDNHTDIVSRSIQIAQKEAAEHIRVMQRVSEAKAKRNAERVQEVEKLAHIHAQTASLAMSELRKHAHVSSPTAVRKSALSSPRRKSMLVQEPVKERLIDSFGLSASHEEWQGQQDYSPTRPAAAAVYETLSTSGIQAVRGEK